MFRVRGEAGRYRLIGRERAYHGVGFGGISVGGIVANRRTYGPMLAGEQRRGQSGHEGAVGGMEGGTVTQLLLERDVVGDQRADEVHVPAWRGVVAVVSLRIWRWLIRRGPHRGDV